MEEGSFLPDGPRTDYKIYKDMREMEQGSSSSVSPNAERAVPTEPHGFLGQQKPPHWGPEGSSWRLEPQALGTRHF